MTDHPRFEAPKFAPDEAHRQYHGGRFVELALRASDHWRARRIPESIDALAARAMMRDPSIAGGENLDRSSRSGTSDPLLGYELAALVGERDRSTNTIHLEDKRACAARVLLVIVSLAVLTSAVWLGANSAGSTLAPDNMTNPIGSEPRSGASRPTGGTLPNAAQSFR